MIVISISLFLLTGWGLMILAAFFFSWLQLPDLLLPALLYLFYYVPQLPLWRALLPAALLMDLSAHTAFGFHGLLYTLTALVAFPLRPYWKTVSDFEQLLGLVLLAGGFQVLKFLLFYIVEGVPAPVGWGWCVLWQLLVWLPVHGATLWFLQHTDWRTVK